MNGGGRSRGGWAFMYHPGTVMGSDQQEVWGRWASSTDRPDRDDRSDEAVTDYSNLPRDATRVPLAHRIQLKFDRFSGFINEYFSNISPGGIFIRTDTPEPPGQLLEFEFRLGAGYELIRGRGEVVWARQRGEGPERPPGMGVRFIELSPGSKDLIYKIVDDYVAHGGKPFDLTPPAALESEPPVHFLLGDMPPMHPGPGAGLTAAAPAEPRAAAAAARGAGPPPPGSPVASPAPGPPAAAPSPPAAGLSSLPWTLELPALQQLPGVPAIPPRSPLEALGAGASDAPTSRSAAQQQPGARSGIGDGAPPQPRAFVGDAMPSHAADPLAQVAAALPPLDELAPEVPALPPAPDAVPPSVPAPAPVPAFSSFDLGAPRRRSRMPLLGALTAIALLGLAVYLLRDPALAWIESYQDARSVQAPAAAPMNRAPASSAPASPAPQVSSAAARPPLRASAAASAPATSGSAGRATPPAAPVLSAPSAAPPITSTRARAGAPGPSRRRPDPLPPRRLAAGDLDPWRRQSGGPGRGRRDPFDRH